MGGIAKHAPFMRVDLFVNTMTGDMVVNEIETYYRVCGYSYDTHALSMAKMRNLYLEGWKKFEERGKLKRIQRVVGRFQDVAPESFAGNVSCSSRITSPSHSDNNHNFNITGVFLWLLSLIAVAGLAYFLGTRKRARALLSHDSYGAV